MAGGVDDLQNDNSKYISTRNSLPAVQRNVKKNKTLYFSLGYLPVVIIL